MAQAELPVSHPQLLQYPTSAQSWSDTATRKVCAKNYIHRGSGPIEAIATGGNLPVNMPTYRNQRCFCLHNSLQMHYVQHAFFNFTNKPSFAAFNKVFAIKHALQAVPMDSWVLWLDQDVFFVNMKSTLRDAIADAVRVRRAMSPCHLVLGAALNNGVMLLRKSCWTMRFLDLWFALRDECVRYPLYDQGPMLRAAMAGMALDLDGGNNSATITLETLREMQIPGCRSPIRSPSSFTALARAFMNNHSKTSSVCLSTHPDFSQEPGMKNPNQLFAHLAGRAKHKSVLECYEAYMRAWPESRSALVESCATDGPLDLPCSRKLRGAG